MAYIPNVFFITTTYLREKTPIQDNVDDDLLNPFILQSQDLELQQIIGETFYDTLKNGVVNNTLNNDEDYLLRNYIQPMLAQWSFYKVYPHLLAKPTNKSISKERSEYSEPIGLDEMRYMRSAIRDTAEFYSKRLQKYLYDHSQLFPTYASSNSLDNMPKRNNNYYGGIYLPVNTGWNIKTYNERYYGDDSCFGCDGNNDYFF